MEVYWCKCKGNLWCELNKLDVDHSNLKGLTGVYVIWYEMQENIVVKIGFGKIQPELKSNLDDLAIQAFAKYKPKVTWCEVPKSKQPKIAAFLQSKLKPKIDTENITEKTKEIEVNLPF